MNPHRSAVRRASIVAAAVAAVVLSARTAVAQLATAAAVGAMAGQDIDAQVAEVQSKIANVERSTELDADAKASTVEAYQSALRTLADIAATDDLSKRFVDDAKAAPAAAVKCRGDLAVLVKRPVVELLAAKSLSELDADRANREARIPILKQELASFQTERSARVVRKAEIQNAQADAEARRAELRRETDAAGAEGPPALLAARRLDATLKLLAFERHLASLALEAARYDSEAAADLLGHRERFKQAELDREEVAIRELSRVIDERRRKEAEEKIEHTRRQLLLTNPLLIDLAKENQERAEKNAALAEEIGRVEKSRAETDRALQRLTEKFNDIRSKEREIGLTRPIGLMLRAQRNTFPDLRKFDEEVEDRQDLIDNVRLTVWEVEELLQDERQPRDYVAETAVAAGVDVGTLPAGQLEELERAAETLLRSRRDVLADAKQQNEDYFHALVELDTADRRYVQRCREYLRYINERILWTRSADPLTVEMVRLDGKSRGWLLSPTNWRGLAAALAVDPLHHPFAFWPTLAAIAALSYVRLRIRPRLRALGGHATKRGFLRYAPTAQAAVLTLMSAVAAPAVLLFLSWRLAEAEDAAGFARAVAASLEACAAVLFPIEQLREACRHMGLAEAHFGWPARAVQHLRRSLTWMKTLGLPVTFFAILSHEMEPLSGGLPTERVLFIAGMMLSALTVHKLLSGGSELSKGFLIEQPASLFSRLRPLWYAIAVTVPLAFAGLAVAGYHYSATQLASRLLWTLWLAAAAVLIRAMAVRWVVLSRRRLLLGQIQQRRNAEEPQDGAAIIPPTVEETDLAKATAQTRKLVDVAMAAVAATGLAMIWADPLPAIGLLNRPLWSVTVSAPAKAAESTPAAPTAAVLPAVSGAASSGEPAVSVDRFVTTFDLAVAGVIAIFTVLASRNLPGLMEMSVLNRLPLDQATRYAAIRLSSYAIVIFGLLMASNRLGLQWQNVQWLVAALTVGLGFGLQEVFANFVSGLIILFERPVRVGDVVTIAEVTGVVSRIRMRATTITNWDRKEFIVPNKEFITGKVLNWTLSDAVNRVTIEVGVAYGSDTDRARAILTRICQDHPSVLKDPPPAATFEGFGESTLKFVVRCFLGTLDSRRDVIHELHSQIDRDFRNAGIDLAFPQRDLHIRSVNGLTLQLPSRGQAIRERAAG